MLARNQYKGPVCLIAQVVCAREDTPRPVLRAAACGSREHRSTAMRRLESAACRDPAAQRYSPSSRLSQMPLSSPAAIRARPNPSLNHRTPNGGLSWPGLPVRGTFSPARAKPSHRRGPVSSNVRRHTKTPSSRVHSVVQALAENYQAHEAGRLDIPADLARNGYIHMAQCRGNHFQVLEHTRLPSPRSSLCYLLGALACCGGLHTRRPTEISTP